MAVAARAIGPQAIAPSDTLALALNSGSSSLKFGLFARDQRHVKLLQAQTIPGSDPSQAMAQLDVQLNAQWVELEHQPDVILHRIVHGGPALREHCRIDATVVAQIANASALAPLHTQAALSIIEWSQKRFPGALQIACFDTAFHARLPDCARALPLAKALRAAGIERYGFHGLACASIVRQLRQIERVLPPRLVIAHLGSGSSVTAVAAGNSIDTSMGLTPSGGCMMATRSGDVDPGVLIHLLRTQGLSADGLERLIDHESGLLGVSGLSGDMRILHQHSADNSDARLAIQMFCNSVQKQIAGMICALGGVDLLVFSGGIGEHDSIVRNRIGAGLNWVGSLQTRVLPALEELEMAHIGFDMVM
jgi:acetate kinase